MTEITDQMLEHAFLNILDQGSNNTHKYALARFLLDYKGSNPRIPPSTIAEHFFKYYWFQTIAARLRQTAGEADASAAIRNNFSQKHYARTAEDIVKDHPDAVSKCIEVIAQYVDEAAAKFQKVKVGRSIKEEKIFFEYGIGPGIELKPEAQKFLKRYKERLHHAVILEWSRKLEDTNPGVPKIFEKIEGVIPQRTPLILRRKVLEPHFEACFYCDGPLTRGKTTKVDHFIPAAFVADDNMWNLVLACKNCNQIKKGSLPPREFLEKLFQRNNKYQHKIQELRKSVNKIGDSETEVARVITGYYDNAIACGFATVKYMG